MKRLSLFGVVLWLAGGWSSGAEGQNNPYGVHTFLQDYMAEPEVTNHLTWARRMTGANGYVKQLIYPITVQTAGPSASWVRFVTVCYEKRMIPVLRIATIIENGVWSKPPADAPGDYSSFAAAVRRVIAGLPLDATLPLYVEVLNEPNNNGEWSGQANPAEYARVLQDVAAALHSISPRVKVANGGLSPGGSYDNRQYIRAMFEAVPNLAASIDAWATHPYATSAPPERNNHNGNAEAPLLAIDSYLLELAVLDDYMDISNLKVIATEGGFSGLTEDTEAAYMMRAFRDHWTQWPEVLGICPWYFCNPLSDGGGPDWVYPDSGTLPDGYPTHRKRIYEVVAALAKPGDATGAISGTVIESAFGTAVGNVQVACEPGGWVTQSDTAGTYFFADLAPGGYTLTFSRRGFEPQARPGVLVTAAQNAVQNVTLVAAGTGTISGTVSDPLSGAPLAGTEVSTSPGGFSAISVADGRYTLAGLPPGTYVVTARRRGRYTHARSGIRVETGDVLTVHLCPGTDDYPAGTSLIPGQSMDDEGNLTGVAAGWTNLDAGHHPEIFAVDPAVRYSGHGAQRIQAGPPGSNNFVWTITNYSAITAGATYLAEIWCRTENLVRGTGRGAALGLHFFSNDMQSKGMTWSRIALEGTTDWTRIYRIAVAPAGSGRLQILASAEGTSGTAWFDNAWAGPASTVTATSPSGFLQTGLNLVSIPLLASRPDPPSAFSQCGGDYDGDICRYGAPGAYEIYPLNFGWLFAGVGYWLELDAACTNLLTGYPFDREQYVPLNNGWSLIGHPFPDARSLAACEVLADGRAYPLAHAPDAWLQKALIGYEATSRYERVMAGGTGDDDALRPWRGYWVRGFRDDLTFVVPRTAAAAPAAPPPSAPVAQIRLTVEAPGIRAWTWRGGLAAEAAEGLDPSDVLAPPSPPAGLSEIRLATELESYGEAMDDVRPEPPGETSAVWRAAVKPVNFVGTECRNVTLLWDTGAAGNYEFLLIDGGDGGIIYLTPGGTHAFDLCAGEEAAFEVRAKAGGFFFGDLDLDGDVDYDDFHEFQACATGPAVPYAPANLPAGCNLPPDAHGRISADLDGDRDVDQTDFALFQACLGDTNVPADPRCAE